MKISHLKNSFLFLFLFSFYTSSAQDSVKVKKVEFGFLPVVAYAPETDLQLGVAASIVIKGNQKVTDKFYRPSTLLPFVIYSFRNQLQFGFEADLFLKNGWNAYNYLRYYIYPDYYYGIGKNTNADTVEIYIDEFARLNGKLVKAFGEKIFLGVGYDFQNDNLYGYKEGKILEQRQIYGNQGGLLIGVGPSFRFDSRDNVLYSSKGQYISLDGIFYGLGGDYNFTLLTVDARQFFNLGTDKNIFGFQFVGRFTDGQIPFYKLPIIGGVYNLRGIRENRFRDNQAMYVQAEYRRYLFWRFRAVAFAGIGSVAPSLDAFDFSDAKYSIGLGLRFQLLKSERLNVRADYGISGDQSGFYFSVREAF